MLAAASLLFLGASSAFLLIPENTGIFRYQLLSLFLDIMTNIRADISTSVGINRQYRQMDNKKQERDFTRSCSLDLPARRSFVLFPLSGCPGLLYVVYPI